MSITNYKDLITQIKCGELASPIFTEDDLAKVKACIPDAVKLPTQEVKIDIPNKPSCVNDGIDKIREIYAEQAKKQALVIELSVIRAKVEEALDHYMFISGHYSERVKFFNDTISKVEPFTSQYIYWNDELNRLRALEFQIYMFNYTTNPDFTFIRNLPDHIFIDLADSIQVAKSILGEATYQRLNSLPDYISYVKYRKARIIAQANQEVAKNGATNALSQMIDAIPKLSDLAESVLADLNSYSLRFSGQLISYFQQVETLNTIAIPARTAAFSIDLVGLESLKITVPEFKDDGTSNNIEKTINIKQSQYLPDLCFENTIATFCSSIATNASSIKSDYSSIPGDLYNGSNNGYAGLYRKLRNPIQYLYTNDERGLTVDPNLIDPILSDIKDAPVSIKSDDQTLYIKNQEAYEKFFDTLQKGLPDKIKEEREVVFVKQISSVKSSLSAYARSEVADQFRKISGMELKLARPTSYKSNNSSIYSQGTFKYDQVDSVLSSNLAYYTKANSELLTLIDRCKNSISHLSDLIKKNQFDEKVMAEKISQIPCFASTPKPTQADCEAKTTAKLGIDPLMIRTLDKIDSTMPDLTTPCYWKKFADALNKVSILPIPDLTSPVFRYYPINNLIPTPVGIVLIPLPQKWKPLFVLSTPLGTIVTFLTMPVAIVGIPLPSIYVLFLAPDGNKYMLFAPNIPVLYGNPFGINYGFTKDSGPTSLNPTGLSGPYSGSYVKGSLTLPLSISAANSKAARLAKLAADAAMGKYPQITTRSGIPIGSIDPVKYVENYISTFERALKGADSSGKDFERQINKFKRNINKQLDRLGPINLTAVTKLKAQTLDARDQSVNSAEDDPNLAKRRKAKQLARKLDPITLESKISGVLADFNNYIDKINLGTIKFPDDPTKLNPKLPSVITGLIPTIEQAATGSLHINVKSSKLISKIKRISATINQDQLKLTKKVFNLNNPDEVHEFKGALKDYSNLALDYLQGKKSPYDQIDPTWPESKKSAVAKSNALRKKRLEKALAFTTLSLVPPSLKLFDPTAPCCPVEPVKFDVPANPAIAAAISIFKTLFEAFIDGLTLDSLKQLLGNEISKIGISTIQMLFNTVLNSIPDIELPEKPDLVAIVKAIFVPIYSALAIPQSLNPLGLPFPLQLVIPLDALVKPLLKAAIAYLLELLLKLLADAAGLLGKNSTGSSSNTLDQIIKSIPCGNSEFATVSTTNSSDTVSIILPNGFNLTIPKIPMIPLDLIGYFALLTTTDLTTLVRKLIMTAIDAILLPVKNIVTPVLSLTKSLKDLSYNVIESANPYIQPIKLIMMAIQLQIPNSEKIKIANLDAINAIRAAYIPVITATEPVVKEIAYLGALIACGLGGPAGVQLARTAANPFFNQDDLPPWERLTQKNPLFAIFLDELAWRSSLTSTGTLLFQSKMPGLYPAAWSPTIFMDPGALSHVKS